MTTTEQAAQLLNNGVVVGSDGEIGKVGQIFVDDQTGQPNWVTVKTGMFGTKESFIPLDNATVDGNQVRVPFDTAKVKGAPNFDADQHLSETEEGELYTYYGFGTATTTTTVETDVRAPEASKDGSMTRSEEQLHVGTQKVEAGRARLRKFVVTEQQTVNVGLSRDEVRVVREPLKPDDTVDASTIGEDSVEVTLTEERAVVSKQTVPVERIRLDKETVTEQQSVTEQVRKEQIEFTSDDPNATVTDRKTRR